MRNPKIPLSITYTILKFLFKGDPIRKLGPNCSSACYKLSFELSTTSLRLVSRLCERDASFAIEVVQLVLFYHIKSDTSRRDVVDSSNESLQHADEELGPNLQIGSPLQRNFQNADEAIADTFWVNQLYL